MLTKLEKKILDYAISKGGYVEKINTAFPKLSSDELYNACKNLDINGYFEVFSVNMCQEIDIVLSYKGTHYREITGLEIRDFFMKSVITPIAVAFITSIITLMLNGEL